MPLFFRFARRNYRPAYKPSPNYYTRRTDLNDYNYYDYTDDQRHEESEYFRK